jgi:flagellar basal body P-ring protein FlgI
MRHTLYKRLTALVLGARLAPAPLQALAFSRVKDLVEVEGTRDNMLVGTASWSA